jgi:hypothetical protein
MSSIYRFAGVGVRGHVLAHRWIAGRCYTTREAVEAFISEIGIVDACQVTVDAN